MAGHDVIMTTTETRRLTIKTIMKMTTTLKQKKTITKKRR